MKTQAIVVQGRKISPAMGHRILLKAAFQRAVSVRYQAMPAIRGPIKMSRESTQHIVNSSVAG